MIGAVPESEFDAVTIGVAIAIPEPCRSELVEARRAAGDPAAELAPPHVTLLPPTEIAATARGAAADHLQEVASRQTPFELRLRGTGTFRPITDVVFVAVAAGIGECELLEHEIRRGPLARTLRYPYHPHVTVAHDVVPAALDSTFDRLAGFQAQFSVRNFTLFQHGDDGLWRPHREFHFGQKG